MRIFLGGSKGLVLYEDEEITQIYAEPLLSAVRPTPNRLIAGTDSGSILISENNGDAWVAVKDLGQGVHSLTASGSTVYAGLLPAGLWASKDLGESWSEVDSFSETPGSESWTAPWGTPVLSAIAANPKDPNTLYCGVEVGGIYRSRNGGDSWRELDIPDSDIHSVQVCPPRPQRIYATTGTGGFCSDDEGVTWREMGAANANSYTMGLAAHPSEADRVIVSAAAGPPPTWRGSSGARCDVYLSTDAGRRFRTVVKGLHGAVQRKALVINSKVPSEVVFGTSTGELFYSNDGGESFDEMAADLGNLRTIVFA